jgi:hypothetical protein
MPANPPAMPAQTMVDPVDSLGVPDHCCSCRDRMVYKPKRAVEYVDCRRMDAERPDHSENIPAPRQAG